jgi:hypothetical protein
MLGVNPCDRLLERPQRGREMAWIDAANLPAVHVGRRGWIRHADFDRMLEQGYSGGRPPRTAPGRATPFASADRHLTGEDFWDAVTTNRSDPTD